MSMDASTSQITNLKQDICENDFDIIDNNNHINSQQEDEENEVNKDDEDNFEDDEEQEKVGKKSRGKYGKKAALHRAAERSIMTALKDDVDNLARQFCSNNTDLTLTRFARIFQAMDFSTIFIGRFTNADLVEFSENLFHYIASYMFDALPDRQIPSYFEGEINESKWKHMFLSPEKRTDAERIFGIFLSYSLYFLQPSQFVIPMYVTVPQMDDLIEYMETVLLPDEQFEALFCLFRLAQTNAFVISPSDGTFNPLLHRTFRLRFETDNHESDQRKLMNIDNFSHLRTLIDNPFFKQAENLHERYAKCKQNIVNQASSSGNEILPQNTLVQRTGPRTTLIRLLEKVERSFAADNTILESSKPNNSPRTKRKKLQQINEIKASSSTIKFSDGD